MSFASVPGAQQIDAFARSPQPAHQAQTYFNLVHNLHETIMQDTAATFVLLHNEAPPAPFYRDWQEKAFDQGRKLNVRLPGVLRRSAGTSPGSAAGSWLWR